MFIKRKLSSYLLELSTYSVPNLNTYKTMGFYMEQVLSQMEEDLKPFEINEKLLTSSMVNNYVKNGNIPAPVNKKYSTIHFTYLYEICSMKNVLKLEQISSILNFDTYKDVYAFYKEKQDEYVSSISSQIKKELTKIKKENEDEELKKLAMELALKANIYKTISDKIISLLDEKKQEEIEKLRKDTTIKK